MHLAALLNRTLLPSPLPSPPAAQIIPDEDGAPPQIFPAPEAPDNASPLLPLDHAQVADANGSVYMHVRPPSDSANPNKRQIK